MDEMNWRALALALRTWLPDLIDDPTAAVLDERLAAALRLPPGRAGDELSGLVLDAPEPVRAWAAAHIGANNHHLRLHGETGPTGVDAHDPAVWVEQRGEDDLDPLVEGDPYTLVAMASVEGSNGRSGVEVAAPGVADGLLTTWLLSSSTVRIEADGSDPDVVVGTAEAGDTTQWQARFDLVVPVDEDSIRRRVRITPLTAPDAGIDVAVMVGDELYRRIPVSLQVQPAEKDDGPGEPDPGCSGFTEPVSSAVVGRLAAAHAGIVPVAWQRPGRRMQIVVLGRGRAMVTVGELGIQTTADWATAGDIPPRIGNARSALRRLREAFPTALELIEPERLVSDLRGWVPESLWGAAPQPAAVDAQAWAEIATSDELFELAYAGYQLYTAVFSDTDLRSLLGALDPGDAVSIGWLRELDPDAPHVPLPLLYLAPVNPGEPVDPMRFLGLRHRLTYNRRNSPRSRALGEWADTTRAHLLYWGDGPGDEVGAEARRHRDELQTWQPLLELPDGEPRIERLQRFLSAPEPSPVSLLYFYCHCVDETGRDPVLRFGPTNGASDVLKRSGMGSDLLPGEPIVFVNACGSASGDPLMINQLMDVFLDRGCRGYIGTEDRIPPGVAARFATTFFSFLYGTETRARAPVGEAMAQARRFLWEHYRNLGGLFYSHVNDYFVYASDDNDVSRLRAAR